VDIEKADGKYGYIVEKISRKAVNFTAILLPTAGVIIDATTLPSPPVDRNDL